MNQPIFIRDLIVNPKILFGEKEMVSQGYVGSTVDRLNALISLLFKLTNEDHRANYCEKNQEGIYHIKKGKKNHITRLMLTEFSFYTQEPLNLQNFNKIYQHIVKQSSKLESNVQIFLSSFAVLNQEKEIVNITFFIEGGNVHCFAKNTASHLDINYNGKTFSQQKSNPPFNPSKISPSYQAYGSLSKDGEFIPTYNLFLTETAGKAKMLAVIEICLDHAHGRGKYLWAELLAENIFIPKQIEQIVISNSIGLYRENILNKEKNITHVDPDTIDVIQTIKQKKENVTRNKLSPKQWVKIKKGLAKTLIIEKDNGYNVRNPPFGGDFQVLMKTERPAGIYHSFYASRIEEHNQAVLEKKLASLKPYLTFQESIILKAPQQILFRFVQLEEKMLSRVPLNAPTSKDSYNNNENQSKILKIRNFIEENLLSIKEKLNSNYYETLFSVHDLEKEFVNNIQMTPQEDIPESLKIALIQDVEETLTKLYEVLNLSSSPSIDMLKDSLSLNPMKNPL